MLQANIKIFGLFLLVLVLFILLRTGQIFDIGWMTRGFLMPQKIANHLFLEPDQAAEDYKNLLAENSRLTELIQENKQLKELLAFRQERSHDLALAYVLSHDPVNQNIIIIDIGSASGVSEGQAVVVNNGIIVGKIIEVASHAAKVRLLTDSLSKLAVKAGSDYVVSGLLTGSLGLGMNLDYIPQEQDIKQNDIVVTAQLEDKIPPGLVVGTVEQVSYKEEEVFKQASIQPIVDYSSLSVVAIIL